MDYEVVLTAVEDVVVAVDVADVFGVGENARLRGVMRLNVT